MDADSITTAAVPKMRWKAVRHYLYFAAGANLLWEMLHLPLYTIWTDETWVQIAFAIMHCTSGDILIAFACLYVALFLFGDATWPVRRFWRVSTATVLLGISATIFFEWLNVEVLGNWAYAAYMPTIPPLGWALALITMDHHPLHKSAMDPMGQSGRIWNLSNRMTNFPPQSLFQG